MSIKLVLDEHFPVEVAAALRRSFPKREVQSIHETEWGGFPDPALLDVLDGENLTLVTRDVNSVPLHVRQRLQAGLSHAGVIYADSKRLKQTDPRGVIRRLSEVIRKHGDEDWRCREGWL